VRGEFAAAPEANLGLGGEPNIYIYILLSISYSNIYHISFLFLSSRSESRTRRGNNLYIYIYIHYYIDHTSYNVFLFMCDRSLRRLRCEASLQQLQN